MTYEVALDPAAARQLRKFDPQARRRIQAAIELLATEPRPPAATRLVGGDVGSFVDSHLTPGAGSLLAHAVDCC